MPMRSVVLQRVSIVVCTLVLAPAIAFSQATKAVPKWDPTPALINNLDTEFKSDGWSIRPPKNMPHRVVNSQNEVRTTWAAQGGGIVVTKVVTKSGNDGRQADLDAAAKAMAKLLEGRAKNMQTNPTEQGTIHGRRVSRIRYSAEGLPGISGRGFGFIYVATEGKTLIAINGFGTTDNILNLEASAQTIDIAK
jgi:hypothetical protein